MLRKLKDVDMWMQYNKVTNLKLACAKLNGIILKPGETFSYWYLIGKPTKRKGYKKGMHLRNGGFEAGYGGGLCQLSNLIFWSAIHTPLTIVERYRHGYDVFPDSNRTQPFASGATCAYPHIDLMIRNDTEDTYQLLLNVGETDLEGQWRVNKEPLYNYKIVERNHRMVSQFWGGYTRHNELYQQVYSKDGELIDDHLLLSNVAVMMYSPFLDAPPTSVNPDG
jgi:vancomycin resistance protein VanW